MKPTFGCAAAGTLALVVGCAAEYELSHDDLDAEEISFMESALGGSNATFPATGELEAVVNIGNCTGTLISQDTVITAGHCVCGGSGNFPATGCATRKTVTFTNVVPAAGGARRNVSVGASVLVHKDFNNGGWLANDYTLLKLDQRADTLVDVAPMRVATALPAAGEVHTLVGYGGASTPCDGSFGTKRKGTSILDEVRALTVPAGKTLTYLDTAVFSCPGDSGGPVIDESGQVQGICSHGDLSTNSNYDPTAEVWPWIRANACTAPDSAVNGGSLCLDGLATIFRHGSYGGASQGLAAGTWDVKELATVGNDQVSSLKARPGATVRLYAEAGCWGDSHAYSGDVSDVGALLNDRTSCVEVNPGVTLYRSTGYSGVRQTFEIGGYSHLGMTTVGNDAAESLIASPGIVVRLCQESGAPGTVGWGNCQEYSGAVASLGALSNVASNVEVLRGVTVYRDADFGGVSQTFKAGSYGASALSAVGNDQISSLIVAPGMTARVCSENGLWGDCQVYTGSVTAVEPVLNNRISSIEITPIL